MTIFTKSVFSFILIFFGLVNMFTMFEIMGRRPRFNPTALRVVHRTSGFIFVAIFATVSYFCIKDFVSAPSEVSTRGLLHAILALVVASIIVIKISVIRGYPQFSGRLVTYGQLIFVIALIMTLLSGGYFFLVTGQGDYQALAGLVGRQPLTADFGRALVESKCSKCHELERILAVTKTPDGWAATVKRMQGRFPGWITDPEAVTITGYLQQERGVQVSVMTAKRDAARKSGPELVTKGRQIFEARCAICHYPDRYEDKVGPGLKGLLQRGSLPLSGRPATEENILSQIREPIGQMPPFTDIAEPDLRELVAFLKTL